MNADPSELDASRLYGIMIALICCNDGDLIDDPACFPCPSVSRNFWMAARDTITELRSNFDYLLSPAFVASVSGRSPQYIVTATRIATQKSSQHNSAFDAALKDALTSDGIFELLPVTSHAKLRSILAEITA